MLSSIFFCMHSSAALLACVHASHTLLHSKSASLQVRVFLVTTVLFPLSVIRGVEVQQCDAHTHNCAVT